MLGCCYAFSEMARVKNPVLPPTDVVGPHGASSKEKAILAIHPRSSGRGIPAFSRKAARMGVPEVHSVASIT